MNPRRLTLSRNPAIQGTNWVRARRSWKKCRLGAILPFLSGLPNNRSDQKRRFGFRPNGIAESQRLGHFRSELHVTQAVPSELERVCIEAIAEYELTLMRVALTPKRSARLRAAGSG